MIFERRVINCDSVAHDGKILRFFPNTKFSSDMLLIADKMRQKILLNFSGDKEP